MVKFQFNKLIRDKIIIKMLDHQVLVETHPLTYEEFQQALKDKLLEEADEVSQANNHEDLIEELADSLEVIYKICENNNITLDQVEKARLGKCQEKGTFTINSFVKNVSFSEDNEKFKPYLDYYLKQPEKYPKMSNDKDKVN